MSIETDILNNINSNPNKTLDVLLNEVYDELMTYVLVPKDETFRDTMNELITATETGGVLTLPFRLKFNTSGAVRVFFTIKSAGSGETDTQTTFRILVNSETIATESTFMASGESYSRDIEIAAGDVMTFELKVNNTSGDSGTGYLIANTLKIGAKDLPKAANINYVEVIE